MKLHGRLAVLAAVYLILAGVLLLVTNALVPPTTSGWEGFVKVAGIGLTLLTSLFAALVPGVIAVPQAARIHQRRLLLEAYRELYAAANSYYRALAPLERGGWDIDRVEKAEERMTVAEGYGFYLPPADEQSWIEYWQHARFIRESVDETSHESRGRAQMWEAEVGELDTLLREFKKRGRDHVEVS